jgi:enamine deaminase RidA (YjgF/YER057c/UK114 family)
MQGVDPATNKLVEDPQARIRRAFLNIETIAESEGASLKDCVRLTVYLSDLPRFAPMVEKAARPRRRWRMGQSFCSRHTRQTRPAN